MSYCLNPACIAPVNPEGNLFCLRCGTPLRLGDRYDILKPISHGGFGRTFLAQDLTQTPSQACVIKQLFPKSQDPRYSAKAAELFQEEAARLSQLGQHPQIPQLLDQFQQRGCQYLVQELIPGETLDELLKVRGTFSETQVRDVLNDLLPVLEFIHRHRVIHRDIKPENIICPHEDAHLVLVDFGASKYATTTQLKATGTVIGSAGYAAPEQVMGKATFASDLYSLGVTCIHLLTGLHPFELYSVEQDNWIWRDYTSPPVSDRLSRVLDKLLQRPIRSRYRTATAVLADLNPSSLQVSRSRPPTGRDRPTSKESAQPTLEGQSSPPVVREIFPPRSRATQTWKVTRLLGEAHAGAVTAIALSSDYPLLASGGSDQCIRLWHLETGELLHTFEGRTLWSRSGHGDRITRLLFSPDSRCLFSASDDGTVRLWDMVQYSPITTLIQQEWSITALALSADGEWLVYGTRRGMVFIWDLVMDEGWATLTQHRDAISGIVLAPNGSQLLTSSDDRTIRLWDLDAIAAGEAGLTRTLQGHLHPIRAIAPTPDWTVLTSGDNQGILKVWSLPDGKPLRSVAAHRDRLNDLVMAPQGTWVASGGNDSRIHVWSLQDGTRGDRLSTLKTAWAVNCLAIDPRGEVLMSGGADETIQVWQPDGK
jgi:serine/threonine protein kinase